MKHLLLIIQLSEAWEFDDKLNGYTILPEHQIAMTILIERLGGYQVHFEETKTIVE